MPPKIERRNILDTANMSEMKSLAKYGSIVAQPHPNPHGSWPGVGVSGVVHEWFASCRSSGCQVWMKTSAASTTAATGSRAWGVPAPLEVSAASTRAATVRALALRPVLSRDRSPRWFQLTTSKTPRTVGSVVIPGSYGKKTFRVFFFLRERMKTKYIVVLLFDSVAVLFGLVIL